MLDMSTGNSPASPISGAPTLADKVRFLGRADSYAPGVETVLARETHMSWVFKAGERVYKLKKPVRFPFLDFSTLPRRETACRAEFSLNRRLAPDVYLAVVPLTMARGALAIGGDGTVVDWLVVMRRLDEAKTLETAMIGHGLTPLWADRIAARLGRFYRHTRTVPIRPEALLRNWRQALAYNRRVLIDPRLGLPRGGAEHTAHVLSQFLAARSSLLAGRARDRLIIDAHGDLRPEHIFLDDGVTIIDCLEFDARLRALDPLDEIAFLAMECERLGAAWAGARIRRRLAQLLREDTDEALFLFYHGYRAMLRARLSITHLLDPVPRTPEKWPRLARAYLDIAARDARRLERLLRRREGR
ncbi:hypothetical protein [Chelatococcus asaccharovorans]|uniref:Aminoglycoside phosphotransferase family enzyme n=1 Tax=Chelatococcus asaccharovorans TaxID=28210 RepID=A0A2V3TW19_9HYPH|nr:hypothetical protein [Chelatococcus asaccharovorans]MBS7706089.1 hypothetical protein [Chelatococcus asaccharovorans]PXW52458.1 aminoglycoside phosphotransferase family enzyme [Chelatococcus asaccharovorans]